jgi:hypothetical protein
MAVDHEFAARGRRTRAASDVSPKRVPPEEQQDDTARMVLPGFLAACDGTAASLSLPPPWYAGARDTRVATSPDVAHQLRATQLMAYNHTLQRKLDAALNEVRSAAQAEAEAPGGNQDNEGEGTGEKRRVDGQLP